MAAAPVTHSLRRRLLGSVMVAIVLVYLLLVVNFQSWMDPLIIISALPAALADTPPALAARLDRLRAAVISAGYVQASLERVPDELDTTRSVRLRPAPEAQPRVVVRFSPAPPP